MKANTASSNFPPSAACSRNWLSGTHYDPVTMQSQQYPSVTSDATFYGDASPTMVESAVAQGKQLSPAEQGARHRAVTLDDFQTSACSWKHAAPPSMPSSAGESAVSRPSPPATRLRSPACLRAPAPTASSNAPHVWTTQGYQNTFLATPAKKWFARRAPPTRQGHGPFPRARRRQP